MLIKNKKHNQGSDKLGNSNVLFIVPAQSLPEEVSKLYLVLGVCALQGGLSLGFSEAV